MKNKKFEAMFLAGAMVLCVAACGATPQQKEETETQEQVETQEQTETQVEANTENLSQDEEIEYEGDAASYFVELYGDILDKHYDAINEQWNEQKLLEEGLSPLLTYCYEGETLQNIGYAFLDIDNDGSYELFIEPISGDEFVDKMLFTMYTCKNDTITQVFCGDARSRYYLGDTEEGPYIVYNYSSSGAAQSMWNYFVLEGDQLTLAQGIIYDEENGENPWSFSFDDGDEPSEEMAYAIIESYDSRKMQPEAIAFSLYR